MTRTVRILGAVTLACCFVVAAARPASAHAVLLSSNPSDRAELGAAPAQVVLEFSEKVSAGLGAIRVFDAEGERVDEGAVIEEGAVLLVRLRDGLGDGAYVVSWRAVSADSHPIHGAFAFTVGDVAAADDTTIAGLLGDDDDAIYERAGDMGRAIAYAGSLLAAGLAAFLAFVHDGGPEAGSLRRVLRAAAVAGAVGVLIAIPIRAALATGLGVSAVTEDGVLGQVLADGIGWSTAATLASLLALAVDAGRTRALTAAGAILGVGAFALAGHTTTSDPRVLTIVADATHAIAGSVWFGGLVGVAVVLFARRDDRAHEAAPIVARFSGMAALALLFVAAGGSVLAWSEVRAIRALTDTSYGQLLLLKVTVVVIVAAIGGWNRFRLVPSLPTAPKAATSRLRRTIRLEVAALVAVLGITGMLVNITPARSAAGIGSIFSTTVEIGDAGGSVNLVVDPNRAGDNSIHLYLFDDAGRTYEPDDLTLSLSLESAGIGPIDREPFIAGPGHWQLDGSDLSIAGTWSIEIEVRTSRFDQETATVEVPVNP